MKKRSVIIIVVALFIVVAGVAFALGNKKNSTSQNKPETSVTTSSKKSEDSSTEIKNEESNSSKESEKTSTSETFEPNKEQKEDEKNVAKFGSERISQAREELQAANFPVEAMSDADIAKYLLTAETTGKSLSDVVAEAMKPQTATSEDDKKEIEIARYDLQGAGIDDKKYTDEQIRAFIQEAKKENKTIVDVVKK
ncbi:hypothetical protein SAMN02745116_01696 [Pilibacter termitis]|jgi:hypothetical protein|uniref:Host cell surface-exposed lipoprotein n=1 Tax=Pilibacter termitis TaxID=263852 RepID=A0A1T4P8Q9_9ENTE|nr:hypothetical protein [Pilibacter termitis]SJZ87781.1 hypothetical protein SAMN02745116_01696 [Pilibacter termitis]